MATWGHDGPPTGGWTEHLLTGAPLERCPMRDLIDAPPALNGELNLVAEVVYPLYKRGHLPVGGGVLDQSARTMDILLALDDVQALFDARRSRILAGGGDGDPGRAGGAHGL